MNAEKAEREHEVAFGARISRFDEDTPYGVRTDFTWLSVFRYFRRRAHCLEAHLLSLINDFQDLQHHIKAQTVNTCRLRTILVAALASRGTASMTHLTSQPDPASSNQQASTPQ